MNFVITFNHRSSDFMKTVKKRFPEFFEDLTPDTIESINVEESE